MAEGTHLWAQKASRKLQPVGNGATGLKENFLARYGQSASHLNLWCQPNQKEPSVLMAGRGVTMLGTQ